MPPSDGTLTVMCRAFSHPGSACGGIVLRLLFVLFALSLIGIAAAGWLDYQSFTNAPLPGVRADTTIDIARGARYRDIVRQIRRERISRAAPLYWRILGRELNVAGRLHAGEYALSPGLTPRELLR
ncbi:MAG: hypothetical protein LBQ20_09415, partial [Rhodanobacter sp.]|nr:hypothetical protein [Rhodanobacter sp.]